jgi:hypothetical protein
MTVNALGTCLFLILLGLTHFLQKEKKGPLSINRKN